MFHHYQAVLPLSVTLAFIWTTLFIAVYRGPNAPMARLRESPDLLPMVNVGLFASLPSWIISFYPSWQMGVALSLVAVVAALISSRYQNDGEFRGLRALATYMMAFFSVATLWVIYLIQFFLG